MNVSCVGHPWGSRFSARRKPVYLLKGDPADARLVIRFHDEDRVVMADEARSLRVKFRDATDEELFLLHEGGYSIVD